MANKPPVSVKIEGDVWAELKQLSVRNGMRIGWMVTQAAKDYLLKWGKKGKP